MTAGLRLSPTTADLDGFRAFVEAKGAVHDAPREANAEVLRFRIGRHFGFVSRRKDGRLTFAGIARPLIERMREEARERRAGAAAC